MVFGGRLRSVIAHVDGAGVETFHKVRIRRLARAANRLSDLDYVVFSAADAIQAADCIATNAPIDLILSDVALPGGVNGPEFVEGLRSRYPEVPVVFMTGYAPDASLLLVDGGPGFQLLRKPFSRAQLAAALQQARAFASRV